MKKLLPPILSLSFLLFSCVSQGEGTFQPTADYVDMDRFLGDWYVIAIIPTVFEREIANGVENYSLTPEGEIRVRYSFRKKTPQGKEKVMYQRGWVVDRKTNAEWRVRPLWPL